MRRYGILQIAALLAGMAALTADGVAAQSWLGDASLGMTVRGSKGRPLAGATVTIAYRDIGFGDGPAPRLTTARGEVAFTGLAEGRWSLKIDHPDYLSYLATLVVRKGKRADVLSEFLEATGEGRLTMRVKTTKGSSQNIGEAVDRTEPTESVGRAAAVGAVEPTPPVAGTPSPTETGAKEPVEPTRPTSESEEPAEPTTDIAEETVPAPPDEIALGQTESDARAVPPIPVATERPASRARQEPASPPSGQDDTDRDGGAAEDVEDDTDSSAVEEVSPTAARAEETSAAGVEPSGPLTDDSPDAAPGDDTLPGDAPAEIPAMPAAEREDIEAASAAAREGAGAVSPPRVETPLPEPAQLTSFQGRDCLECRPGEWAVSVSSEVETLSPSSCEVSETDLGDRLRGVAAAEGEKLEGYWGPLPATGLEIPDTLAELLGDNSCRLMAVVLPRGSRYAGFRLQARDNSGDGDCSGERPCPIGDARWMFEPSDIEASGTTIVFSVFRNTATAVERTAAMTVYFVPGADWLEAREASE
jgi:hypothetical protein